MIPKIIHYVWLGGPKTETVCQTIDTWRKKAPDYDICEWNEQNLKILNKNNFYHEALEQSAYAFASDYARLYVLEKYGGIYMDTDMRLLRNPNKYLKGKELAFSSQDKDVIFSTSFIAAEKNQYFIKRCLELYETQTYKERKMKPNTELLSPLLFDIYGFKHSKKTQSKGKITIYNPNIFLQPSFRAVACHIGEKTWAPKSKHDILRIRARKHIYNNLEAGTFRIINDIVRKLI